MTTSNHKLYNDSSLEIMERMIFNFIVDILSEVGKLLRSITGFRKSVKKEFQRNTIAIIADRMPISISHCCSIMLLHLIKDALLSKLYRPFPLFSIICQALTIEFHLLKGIRISLYQIVRSVRHSPKNYRQMFQRFQMNMSIKIIMVPQAQKIPSLCR